MEKGTTFEHRHIYVDISSGTPFRLKEEIWSHHESNMIRMLYIGISQMYSLNSTRIATRTVSSGSRDRREELGLEVGRIDQRNNKGIDGKQRRKNTRGRCGKFLSRKKTE
jgi:hypothetical protein